MPPASRDTQTQGDGHARARRCCPTAPHVVTQPAHPTPPHPPHPTPNGRSLPLPTLRGCDVTDALRFEFVVAAHGGREYNCRAVDSKSFKYWVEGLQARLAFAALRMSRARDYARVTRAAL